MGVTDTYTELQTESKNKLFEEIFELKEEKSIIEKRLKVLEAEYKPMLGGYKNDLYLVTTSGIRFSIRHSQRKGNINAKAMEADGIDVEFYRNKPSEVWTLRKDT